MSSLWLEAHQLGVLRGLRLQHEPGDPHAAGRHLDTGPAVAGRHQRGHAQAQQHLPREAQPQGLREVVDASQQKASKILFGNI